MISKKTKNRVGGKNNPMYGKKHTEEVKRAHSQRMAGENNPNWQKRFSEETKKKMSEARKAYWTRRRAT
jgi:hypothetical protein